MELPLVREKTAGCAGLTKVTVGGRGEFLAKNGDHVTAVNISLSQPSRFVFMKKYEVVAFVCDTLHFTTCISVVSSSAKSILKYSMQRGLFPLVLWLRLIYTLCILSCNVNSAQRYSEKPEFESTSFRYTQLNLSLFDKDVPFVLDFWKKPYNAIDKLLETFPNDDEWGYHSEYRNVLLQSYRTMQAYQSQRFVLGKDVMTTGEFTDAYANEYETQSAISITLSFIIEMAGYSDSVCFFGDASLQHIYQFSQGCQSCILRYYRASKFSRYEEEKLGELLALMLVPFLLQISTLESMIESSASICDISFYDDSALEFFSHHSQKFPSTAGAVILRFVSHRNEKFQKYIMNKISDLSNIAWHSSIQHYTASTILLHFDGNGFVYRKVGTEVFLEGGSKPNPISAIHIGIHQNLAVKSSVSSKSDCPSVVVTYVNRIFYETAIGLRDALANIGISNVEIWGDMSEAFAHKYLIKGSPASCSLPIQIAIAPHEDTLLFPNFIVLHMEQTWSYYSSSDQRYKRVVQEAKAIWLMSWKGIQSFSGLGIDRNRFFVLPLYTRFDYAFNTLQRFKLTEFETTTNLLNRIAVFGSNTPRRVNILLNMSDLQPYLWGSISNPSASYFGRERDLVLLRQAKVVVNVHSEDDSSLEVHRINTLLAQGKCVVSERGSDPLLTAKYEKVVVFSDKENLESRISEYFFNDSARRNMELKALQFALDMHNDLEALEESMIFVLREVFFDN